MTFVSTTSTDQQPDDDRYEELLAALRGRFCLATDPVFGAPPVFTTNAAALWETFLAELPADRRQHYTCRACSAFVERFGGLVVVDAAGITRSALWDASAAPPLFVSAVRALERLVQRAEIEGIFLADQRVLGVPQSEHPTKAPGLWHHMAVLQEERHIYKPTALKTTYQATAEKREEYGMLCRGLAEFSIDVVRKAHALLTTGNLYRSEKCIGIARWLLDLHEARDRARSSTVLPEAERIELFVKPTNGSYAALVTAANPEAPPILQWDREDKRNPVSWYLYNGGSEPAAWNLKPSTWCVVTALALQPSLWGDETKHAHQGASLFVLLEGARDLRHERSGGFFPETLRSEYHGVRATMEAYAKGATIAGKHEATACGLKLETGKGWDTLVRVTSKGTRVSYRLDRWD